MKTLLPFMVNEVETGEVTHEQDPAQPVDKLVNLLASGKNLGPALYKVGSKALKDTLRTLLLEARFEGPVRQEMVRAGLNKLFLKNVDSSDPHNQMVALQAARQIAADPEVGLNQAPQVGVTINIGDISQLLARLDSDKEMGNIIDVKKAE